MIKSKIKFSYIRVFPRPFRHGGFVSPPYGEGGTSAGGQGVNGGTHQGGT